MTACVLCLATAAPAIAAQTHAPPGISGVDEYLETIPDRGGSQAATPGGNGHGRGALPGATAKALARLGRDGGSVAAFAQRTAPPRGPALASAAPHENGRGVLSTVLASLTGTRQGASAWLPILLLGAAIGGAYALIRRRRGPGPGSPPADDG